VAPITVQAIQQIREAPLHRSISAEPDQSDDFGLPFQFAGRYDETLEDS
jgi:hypothetical protein